MTKLKTIFMGTPDFAVSCLDAIKDKVDLITIITQPDKPSGRGHKLTPPPVKTWALDHNIPVLQPERIKTEEFIAQIAQLQPDLIIVVAFGRILTQQILDLPKFGCINVHASLLPKYRGAAPIEWSIINGETKTGVTTMLMNAGLDTGDMLVKREVEITDDMILPELREKLMHLGADALVETIEQIENGTLNPQKQDDTLSNYAPMLNKETGRIDWQKSSREVHNLVRGLYGNAYTIINDKKYKICRTKILDRKFNAGEVVCDKNKLIIGTGDGSVEVLEIHAPNCKKMSPAEYLCGHKI